jgi:small-conductance mechanosensitive channel
LSTIPDLIFLVILGLVVRIVLRLVRRFFDAVDAGRIHLASFEREWAKPTYRLVRPAIIAFAVVVGYPYIPGSGSEAFKGVSILVGIVFSLGSSSFIANMIAGYSMTYRRAFRLGDLVQIGDVTGVVSDVRLQVTHMRTIKNEEVVLPNSQILNTHVTNYSTLAQTKGLILHTTVGIGYETPWRQVEAMLLEAARRTPGLMADPPPFVFHLLLGDFCVTYELNVYCSDALKMRATYTDLHRHILDVFNEYGVQIMTPAYEGDPEVAKVVPKDQWYLAPAKPDASPDGEQGHERGQTRI